MSKTVQTVLVAALLSAHFILGLGAIRACSPTYDEPVHFAAGWSYLKADDYRYNTQDHPPFAKLWAALPLLFLSPSPALPIQHPYWEDIRRMQYPFSNIFLYHNRVDPEKMLNLGRAMILVLSCALGLMIFVFSRSMFGELSGILALASWCFLPAALANGTLVTTDTALALFFFSSIYLFKQMFSDALARKSAGLLNAVLFGVSLGLLFASKYSAVGVLPVLFLLMVYLYLKDPRAALAVAKEVLLASAVAFATLLIVYRFNDLGPYFFDGLKKVIAGINSGRSSFLLGNYSTEGWLYYFPVTFLLKTPVPLLAALALSVFFRPSWKRESVLFLLLPAAVFFCLCCVSKVQIGHRHILPVYPFLIVWVSGLAAGGVNKYLKYLFGLLVLLSALSAARIHPWYISYFNEFISSPDEGYKYLTDSNLDWGQGLKELGKYLKEENSGGIYFCYFGTGDPSYYGIRYVPIGFIDGISPPYTEKERTGDKVDFKAQPKTLFAISATNLQATYYADKNVFAFLKKAKPVNIAAHSIFIYDLTADPRLYEEFRRFTAGVNRKRDE